MAEVIDGASAPKKTASLKPAWQPGQSGNPAGRPKGSRNKLGEAFVEALHDDFNEHGLSVIEKVRAEKPDQYLKVIAQVIPKEVHHTVEEYDELSDDELLARFLTAASSLGRGDPIGRRIAAALGASASKGQVPN